jgi:hypothetical protein
MSYQMSTSRTAFRICTPVTALVAVALTVSGCGSGKPAAQVASVAAAHPSGSASASASLSPEQAQLKFAQCMRSHGVNVQDPQPGGGITIQGKPGDNIDAAQRACQQYLPRGAGPQAKKLDAAEQDKALKFARCMRQHGVDMPDPNFSGGGVQFSIRGSKGSGTDPNSATFQKAQKACQKYFGPPGGKGGGIGTTNDSGSGSGQQLNIQPGK